MKKFEFIQDHLSLFTQRLNIRKISKGDAFFIYNLRSNEENLEYVEMNPYENVQRAESFIEHVTKDMEKQEVFFWIIETKADKKKIGTVCLWSFSKDKKSAEIGYELLPSFQKKGYANEAMESIIDFAENKLGLEKIDAITHEGHQSSIKLLLKNDFKLLGKVNELIPNAEDGPEMMLYRKIL
jgi:ribosomal-protein-alanine N-acetyltransferase